MKNVGTDLRASFNFLLCGCSNGFGFVAFGTVIVNLKDKPPRVNAHPHAGIIPTTYFLAGNGHHRDSLNYDYQIRNGDFMMFTSGKGAIHLEETGRKLYDGGGLYHGILIWLNMSSAYKFIDPSTDVPEPKKWQTSFRKIIRPKLYLEKCLAPNQRQKRYSLFFNIIFR